MVNSLVPGLAKAERSYAYSRACLLLSLCLLVFIIPLAFGVQPSVSQASPAQNDAGSRYHLCFTATDSYYNQTTTKCMYVTVVGVCTLSTADVNIDGLVDIGDLSIVALHYHENNTGPQPYNPLNTPQVGLDDLACVALYYHQTDPLP